MMRHLGGREKAMGRQGMKRHGTRRRLDGQGDLTRWRERKEGVSSEGK